MMVGTSILAMWYQPVQAETAPSVWGALAAIGELADRRVRLTLNSP